MSWHALTFQTWWKLELCKQLSGRILCRWFDEKMHAIVRPTWNVFLWTYSTMCKRVSSPISRLWLKPYLYFKLPILILLQHHKKQMHQMSNLMPCMYRSNKLLKMCNWIQFIQRYLWYQLPTCKWSDNLLKSTGYLCAYMPLFVVWWQFLICMCPKLSCETIWFERYSTLLKLPINMCSMQITNIMYSLWE